MSQLIEKNGKFYKQAKVVMLPTEKANLHLRIHTEPLQNILSFYKSEELITSKYLIAQHLFIIDDSEIKEGDWFINLYSKNIFKNKDGYGVNKNTEENKYANYALDFVTCKKIIATTDSSLMVEIDCPDGLEYCEVYHAKLFPSPSKSFIEAYIREYNKGNVISDIFVEVNLLYQGEPLKDYKEIEHLIDFNHKPERWSNSLKLSSSNEITISKVEPKVYTQEQVDKFIKMIDERIEMSNSHIVAYTIIKNNFLKIFK